MANSDGKLIQLEAARGIASLIVVVHHVVLAFAPGLKAPFAKGGLENTPVYLALNGTAAVVFFFVLSGFVLTRRLYDRFDAVYLVQALIKRLPRLMLPAGITILAGFLIIYDTPPYYKQAAMLTASRWLASFANGAAQVPREPMLSDALRQCLFVFLRFKDAYYNSNLWTMVMEFYGSLVVFALAAALGVWRGGAWLVVALHLAAVWALVAWGQPLMVGFPLGSLMAWAHVHRPRLFQPPRWAVVLMLVTALACYSIEDKTAFLLGASLTLILLLSPGRVQRALARRFGAGLGRLSFPLYLVHMLVIMAVTCPVFLAFPVQGDAARLALTLPVTFAAAILCALPLVWLEARWLPLLNRAVKALVARFSAL
jgi:peptidoglycan/LPS O-acetylase OafA/YrhL